MLITIAPMVRRVGVSRVNPSVYFNPTAQQTSITPAIKEGTRPHSYYGASFVLSHTS